MTNSPLRVLVADDEELALSRLRRLLGESGRVEIVAEARNIDELHAHYQRTSLDAMFLDLNMPGGSSLDYVLRQSAATKSPHSVSRNLPALVFVTAYPEHAHHAFDINALDYLVKPISAARVQQCLDKLDHHRMGDTLPGPPTLAPPDDGSPRAVALTVADPNRVVLRQRDRIDLVPIDDIECCVAQANYVDVITPAQTFVVRETLSAIEQLLKSHGFLRIHRSYLVRAGAITNLMPVGNGEYRLKLRGGMVLESSRAARGVLLATLGLASSESGPKTV